MRSVCLPQHPAVAYLFLVRPVRSMLSLLCTVVLSGCSLSSYGVFRNDTSNPVRVSIVSSSGQKYGELTVAPHTIAKTNIGNGKAAVSTLSGKPLARCELMPPKLIRQYYDFDNRAFYY